AQDVARGHISAFHNGEKGEIYYLGGEQTTWHDMFCRVARLLEVKEPPRPFPVPLFYAIAYISEAIANMTQRVPFLTPELVFLLNGKSSDPDIVGFTKGKEKAKRMGYESRPLDDALGD